MKKKLVTAQNIKEFVGAGVSEIVVDNSMIITAGAKDYLRENKIKLIYGKQAESVASAPAAACSVGSSQDLKTVVARIVSILRNDLQVRDAAVVESVTQKVLCGLKRS